MFTDFKPTDLIWVAVYIAAAYPIIIKAVRNIRNGEIFDENFLMMVASFGALLLGEYLEGIAVMALYRIGEYLQDRAVDKSRRSITSLMDIRPDYANLEQDGELVQVSPETLQPGQIIVIKPGERIAVDGVVLEGASRLDTAAITGESVPRDVLKGDQVYSGTINMDSVLRVEVSAPADQSTAARILELVEDAAASRAKAEKFITRFARWYTPAVCGAAALLIVLPPLLFHGDWSTWIYRGLCFLVVSCPCALLISIPLGFFAGIGAASSRGILVKGGNYLEALTKLDTIVFDKTGTLTKGNFKLAEIVSSKGISEGELLETAALAESFSNHPIAKALSEAYDKDVDASRIEDASEIAGKGVSVKLDGQSVLCGNAKLMADAGISVPRTDDPGTVIHVAVDGKYLGYILIADEIKGGAKAALAAIKAEGINRLVMLTGDRSSIAQNVADKVGLDAFYGDLLPQDKVSITEKLMKELPEGKKLAFVGDGINDAPVLARADLGIAMGSMGSAAAVEAADIVLMKDDPSDIATALKISKKTMRIIIEDIVFSIGVKLLVLLLTALGISNMWLAIFADVGVCMLAILNSMRALRVPK
ncbi:MAG: cadmium-translocating P-type ATPase [Firmicutes bacterium]|nr:cadmium-translocating P-type ATPase [Bacillota bacterium]